MTAPNAAPAETPSRPGSAKGLRVTPCSTAPDNPNAAPTSSASTARGRRSCVMISVARSGSRDHSPCHTSATGSQTRPAISEMTAADTSNSKITPLSSHALVIDRCRPLVVAALGPIVRLHHVLQIEAIRPADLLEHGARVEGGDVSQAQNGDRTAAFGHADQLPQCLRIEQ